MSNREIEIKLVFLSNTCQALIKELTHRFGEPLRSCGRDYFYRSRGKAEFLRLREGHNSTGLLCSKTLDKGGVIDREEIEVEVSDFTETKRVLDRTHPTPNCLIKTYCIWSNAGVVYSLYAIHRDPEHVFFEIEAGSPETVRRCYDSLSGHMPYHKICRHSLYKMYFGGEGVPRLRV